MSGTGSSHPSSPHHRHNFPLRGLSAPMTTPLDVSEKKGKMLSCRGGKTPRPYIWKGGGVSGFTYIYIYVEVG